jgi:hypothetical protein
MAEKVLGATIEGLAMHQNVSGTQECQGLRGDGRHAAGVHGRRIGVVPKGEPVFQDFQVRVVQAAVYETWGLGRAFLPQSVGKLEEGLAVLSGLEYERRCLENRALYGAF